MAEVTSRAYGKNTDVLDSTKLFVINISEKCLDRASAFDF